jgi:hypothetical protein
MALNHKIGNKKPLFHTVERDTNNVYYFCTTKEMRIKACTWLDSLKAHLDEMFDYKEVDNVTTDDGKIMQSYRSVVSEYSKDASTTYN